MTTLMVLADLIEQVGGDKVRVTPLVPPGGEVHTYQPTPDDIKHVAQARVVFYNGAHLEEWIDETIRSAGKSDLKIVVLSQGLPTITEKGGEPNPHLWLDVTNTKAYVEKIRDNLTQVDGANSRYYAQRTRAYLARLDELDAWIRAEVEKIPPARRTLVTFHDAFPYFAKRYGFTLEGVVVASPGKEPSAKELAALVRRIKRERVPAVFAEAQFNPKTLEVLAKDAGVRVVSNLYNDSLSTDAEANSYIVLMQHNLREIVKALR
ncbi:MAG TPA: metal ABC transporter substrate-binding protein [Candidatus Methylomirabilis sp.]|nr:metal ABC transporter substrate-binding protein [Candidatus Methylomirabilis sp.]HSC71424.1 metal ABC transporter substrate-binding protein [Candidatus Methylomirabilis sp.]